MDAFLIADRLIALTDLESISLETIRSRLKENQLKPWQKKMWCIGQLNADFIAQMEEVLELYAQPANPKEPVINFDEAMKQMVSIQESLFQLNLDNQNGSIMNIAGKR